MRGALLGLLGALFLYPSFCMAAPTPVCYVQILCVNRYEEKVVSSIPFPDHRAPTVCGLSEADKDVCARLCQQKLSMVSMCTPLFVPPAACVNPPCTLN